MSTSGSGPDGPARCARVAHATAVLALGALALLVLAPGAHALAVDATVAADAGDPVPVRVDAAVDAPALDAGTGIAVPRVAAPGVAGLEGAGDGAPRSRGAIAAEAVAEAAPALVATGLLAYALSAFEPARLLAAALYSRLAPTDLLRNPARSAVYGHVRRHPGVALTEVARATGLGWGTTVYHLERLERARLVTTARGGGVRRFWASGEAGTPPRGHEAALAHPTARALHDAVSARPGIRQKDLCAALGLSASAASKTVAKLAREGLLVANRDGREVRCWPSGTATATHPARASPGAPAGAASAWA